MTDTFRPVAMACAYTGLRVSEALGLRWRDVDLDADTLDVTGQLGNAGERLATTKTQASAATVRVLPALRRELKAHRSRQAARNIALVGPDALVFTTTSGKPQSRRTRSGRSTRPATPPASTARASSGSGCTTCGVRSSRSRSSRA